MQEQRACTHLKERQPCNDHLHELLPVRQNGEHHVAIVFHQFGQLRQSGKGFGDLKQRHNQSQVFKDEVWSDYGDGREQTRWVAMTVSETSALSRKLMELRQSIRVFSNVEK